MGGRAAESLNSFKYCSSTSSCRLDVADGFAIARRILGAGSGSISGATTSERPTVSTVHIIY
eukprot:2637035-Pyramimonas_sp.AAC.1